jgi:hypothetical protein
MINLRKEVWDDGNQDWWNMAAVDEILEVLPNGERQVWLQFTIDDKAKWIEHWPINFWRFLHYRCGQLERASKFNGWKSRKAVFAEQKPVNRENDLELASQQSAVSAQALAGHHAVQPGGSARFSPTHECSECRVGSQVENSSGDDWSIPEGASLRRVDDAIEECTDDWSIPEVAGYTLGSRRLESARPDPRRVDSAELPTRSNGNAQGEWDSPMNQRADSRGSFGASGEEVSGIPPKSLGKSLSSQVLSDDDRVQRDVHCTPTSKCGKLSFYTHSGSARRGRCQDGQPCY